MIKITWTKKTSVLECRDIVRNDRIFVTHQGITK